MKSSVNSYTGELLVWRVGMGCSFFEDFPLRYPQNFQPTNPMQHLVSSSGSRYVKYLHTDMYFDWCLKTDVYFAELFMFWGADFKS